MLRALTVLLLVTLATTVEAVYDPYSSAAFLSPASYAGSGYGYGYGLSGVAGVGVPGVGFTGGFPAVHGHSAVSGREQPNLQLACKTQSMEVTIQERRSDNHQSVFSAFNPFFAKQQQQQGLNVSIDIQMPREFEFEKDVKELSIMVAEYGIVVPGETAFCNGAEFGPGLASKKKKKAGTVGLSALSSLGYTGLGYAAPAALAAPVGYLGVASSPFAFSHGKVGAARNRRQQVEGLLATIDRPEFDVRQLIRIENLPEFTTLKELAGKPVLACPERVSVGYDGRAECRSKVMPACCVLGYQRVSHGYPESSR